ncbi:MAG: hypothetical protein ABI885_19885 [Gammaproteobacteria bacterium]
MSVHLFELLIAGGVGVVAALIVTLIKAIDRLESLAPAPELPESGDASLPEAERNWAAERPQSPGG